MNVVALIVAASTAIASLGVAIWTWYAVASVGDELRDLAGLDDPRITRD